MDKQDIEHLDLDLDIGSSEGLSVDQLTRSRLQFLLGQNANIIRQTQFADAKAATLLAIVGVLTLIVADRQLDVQSYLLAAHFLVTVVIVAMCLVALLPRVPSKTAAETNRKYDLFSWPSLSRPDGGGSDFAALMRTSNASQLVMSIARSNESVAGVLHHKYKWLRRALLLGLVDLIAVFALLTLPTILSLN